MDDNKVAVLLEDLRKQFSVFGEGLQLLNDKVDRMETKLDNHIEENRRESERNRVEFERNHQEHHQLMQMIKELDTEVTHIKRIK